MRRLAPIVPAVLLFAACADGVTRAPTAPGGLATDRRGDDDGGAVTQVGPSQLLPPETIGIRLVASGLTSPLLLTQPDRVEHYRFIVDQIGLIRVLNKKEELQDTPFLDLRAKIPALNPRYDERGLLGLAFHPQFAKNGRFFVFYTAPPRASAPAGYNNTVTVSEFRLAGRPNRMGKDGPVVADPGSERIVLQVDHPQANHNGGAIAFGADGYLYIAVGDGGNRDDVGLGHVDDWYAANAGGNGQDLSGNLLGSILRIDVDRGAPYAIPRDNPFVGRAGLDEIWAYGFRNPYQMSFDSRDGRSLLAMDAGQELWEEVSRVVRGGNYGWNVKEGTHCFSTVDPTTGEPLRDPVIEYANVKNPIGGLANTIVGGYMYRGSHVKALRGVYVFGGFSTSFTAADGRLFAATPRSGLWPMRELLVAGAADGRLGHAVKGFGEDRKGELYVTATLTVGPAGTTGKVFQIVRPDAKPDDDDR
jgi:glucose/arabinose dehydrogenase